MLLQLNITNIQTNQVGIALDYQIEWYLKFIIRYPPLENRKYMFTFTWDVWKLWRFVTLYGSAEAAAAAETRCGADAAWAANTSCAVCWVAVRPAVAELWNGGGKYGDWNSETGVLGAPGNPAAEDIPCPTRSYFHIFCKKK